MKYGNISCIHIWYREHLLGRLDISFSGKEAPWHVCLYVPRTYSLLFIFPSITYFTPMCFMSFPDLEIVVTNQLNHWHVHLRSSCIALTRLLTTLTFNQIFFTDDALSIVTVTMKLCHVWTLCSTRVFQPTKMYVEFFVHSN